MVDLHTRKNAQNSVNLTAYMLLFFTTLFWSGNAIAGKLAVEHVSPMTLTLLRWVMAFAIMVVIGGPQLKKDWQRVKPALPVLLSYGIVGFAGFNIALYSALNYTSAINVTIEQGAIPLLIFIGNFLLFRIKVTTGQMVGFSLTLAGVIVVASNGSLTNLLALQFNRGDLLMGIAGIFYAAYSIALRYKPDVHWKSLLIVMAFSALLTSIPFAIWELGTPRGIFPTTSGWIIAVYTAVFPAILCQVFYIRGVDLIGPNRAGLFINLIPILGTLLAVVILGEAFGWHHAFALVLVLGGITLAERARAKDA